MSLRLGKRNWKKLMSTDPLFEKIGAHPGMIEKYENLEIWTVAVEPTLKCYGSCKFCLTGSTPESETHIPKDRLLEIVDEAEELGVRSILWVGGDPLEHPDFFEILDYSCEKGFDNNVMSSGTISQKQARRLARRFTTRKADLTVGIHIDSINQEVYNRIHSDPSTLWVRMQGYRNLLKAGFPADHTYASLTCIKPVLETYEETVDWFMDEMGAVALLLNAFRPHCFGDSHRDWENSKSELKRMVDYRAKKQGEHWLNVNPTDGGCLFCGTMIYITASGDVYPCSSVQGVSKYYCGSIYDESLVHIFHKHRDLITFNFEVQGYCGRCPNNPYCVGCRGNAFWGTGDLAGSDLKCHWNRESQQEYIYQN